MRETIPGWSPYMHLTLCRHSFDPGPEVDRCYSNIYIERD